MGEQVELDLNQYLSVTISNEKTVAYIQFIKEDESFSCTEQVLEGFLLAHGVKYGLQEDIIRSFVLNPKEYYFSRTPVAYGVDPIHGVNGSIRYTMPIYDDFTGPLENEDGSVDYKEVTKLNNIQRGQLIAELVPPTDGRSGIAVTGEELPYKAGKNARFKMGKNVVLNGEQTAMYAAIDGLVTPTERGKVNVFPVFEVNGDVDYSTGNINFVGTVVVRGNVLTGFRITASGDIRVIGGVEGAELIAEGSIDISGGIIGYNKGIVKAGLNVKSSFVQDGNVHASADILVSQSIMHSHIRAGQNVICNGPKGLIIGGNVQAGDRVIARVIGNPMSTATTIEVGALPELRNELVELKQQFKEIVASLDKSEKALTLLDQLASLGKLTQDKMDMRTKLNMTKKLHKSQQVELKERMLEIEKSLEDTSRAKVQVIKMIYGGSKIVIGRYTKFVNDPISRMTFYFSEGDILMSAYV
ncbi:uncharacterized protein (DUF342 family) [Paenibacillus shirakamiensis]|uniref:Uncharacterized protein (DUF342 family) n=1 Tax=Paenibacillus shirakamiensis TaxID=1265935 RepID=A0ABS4JHA6_9BACL|nr:FapA family protein [Paenibacillus shirakamiensis]MBP2001092.1 uncharacterized protein (DUF342 family) [Paenibacillus shirakamiensis]